MLKNSIKLNSQNIDRNIKKSINTHKILCKSELIVNEKFFNTI